MSPLSPASLPAGDERCSLAVCCFSTLLGILSVLVKPCSEDKQHRVTSSSDVHVARMFTVRFQGLASFLA